MNPQTLYIFQILVNSGVPPQQAWTQAQQMAQQAAAPGGGTSGGSGLIGQLMTLLGAGGQLGAEGQVFGQQEQAAQTGLNPQAEARGINQLTKKLSPTLINAITRDTAPSIAGRGLATSPGMSQEITAEALAPYQLQEQQLAQNQYQFGQRQPFGVGSGAAGGYPADIANLGYLMSIIGSQA
jgi:hypothetical protein